MANLVAQKHDVASILSASDRDFVIRNDGSQVKVESLKGKRIGLYFSASWCGPCRTFTPKLVNIYNELSSKGDFEIIFISSDFNSDSFDDYFSKMPWLAIPFTDSETLKNLKLLFHVYGIPNLTILDDQGNVATDDGTDVIHDFGVDAYPFTAERIKKLKEQEEEAKKNQSLKYLLESRSRDFVIAHDGRKVPVAELEGKLIGLYFSLSSYPKSAEFTPKLIDFYEKVRINEDEFEIVEIPLDESEDPDEDSEETFKSRPWFTLPIGDEKCKKLLRIFELQMLPTLVIIGKDGKTVHKNVAEVIEEHGIVVYPFSPEKFAYLEELEKAKEDAQTLESFLVSGELDYVIGKGGVKVPVSDLVGKTILLSFSAHWCPPCRAFLPTLIDVYTKIKAQNEEAFEVIFISSDRDQSSFDDYYSQMPWLALPFKDERKDSLASKFKVGGIPMVVAIGPTGKTITREARELIMIHGADAYPFTKEHLNQLESKLEEMTKGWPEKLKHSLHEDHELVLTRRARYGCDGCGKEGLVWSYYCDECDYDLHPECALKVEEEATTNGEGKKEGETTAPEGWICEDGVCRGE